MNSKRHLRTTKDVLPFTFGEELVANDPTALLETGFEPIGTFTTISPTILYSLYRPYTFR